MFGKVNGFSIISGAVTLRRRGTWVAALRVDCKEPDKVSGALTVSLADGALSLAGAVVPDRSGTYGGAILLRAVGGAGKLGTPLPSRFYTDAPARLVIGDILREAGEALSSTSTSSVLAVVPPKWSRAAAPAARALGEIVTGASPAAVWRVLPDGSVWVGIETWPLAPALAEVVTDEAPHESRIQIATENPVLLPGMTFRARHVDQVRYVLTPKRFRAEVLFA